MGRGFYSQNPGGMISKGTWQDSRVVFMSDGGSASFVDYGGKTLILSCAHRDIKTHVEVGQQYAYQCFDGSHGVATVTAVAPFNIGNDPLSDCATYAFTHKPDNAKTFTISNRPLSPGDRVWVSGFPMTAPGYFSRSTTVLSLANGTLILDGPSTPGESGGPIVNQYGELVGTLTASALDGTNTIACYRDTEIQLCQGCCGGGCSNGSCAYGGQCGMSSCSGGYCSSGGCPNGSCSGTTYTTVPRPTVSQNSTSINSSIQTLYENQKKIYNQYTSINDKLANQTPASSCSCSDKWSALDTRLSSIESSIAAIKPCKCDHTDQTAQITEISNRLTQIETTLNQKQPVVETPPPAQKPRLLEGIVRQVPK
jgi:hypothetical protein